MPSYLKQLKTHIKQEWGKYIILKTTDIGHLSSETFTE